MIIEGLFIIDEERVLKQMSVNCIVAHANNQVKNQVTCQ